MITLRFFPIQDGPPFDVLLEDGQWRPAQTPETEEARAFWQALHPLLAYIIRRGQERAEYDPWPDRTAVEVALAQPWGGQVVDWGERPDAGNAPGTIY